MQGRVGIGGNPHPDPALGRAHTPSALSLFFDLFRAFVISAITSAIVPALHFFNAHREILLLRRKAYPRARESLMSRVGLQE
jgi:hypothetical protein